MVNTIKFNNAPAHLFETNAAEVGGSKERADLVACARLLMYEANGRETNNVRANAGKGKLDFSSRIDAATYSKTNESFKRKLMLYAAKQACNVDGRTPPENYEAFKACQRDFMTDTVFFRTLAGIIQEAVRPVLPYVISNAVGELGQMVSVPLGETYEIDVASNDVMIFSDSSWGANRSVPTEMLYERTFTMNPQPKAAKFTMKWYQMVGNDVDMGVWMNSLAAGLYSKIMGMWTESLISASQDTTFIPSYLTFSTFNTANFASAAKYVAEANHIRRDQVMAFGDLLALSKILPSGTPADAALTWGLGSEWIRNGYLGTVFGVPLFEVQNVIIPGKQNTTGGNVFPTDQIWLAARPGVGYAPLYIAFEDGTPITIQLDPRETADMTIDVLMMAPIAVAAVFGSKVATITNV